MPNNPGNLFKQYALILICPLLLIVCIFPKTTSFVAANIYHCTFLDQLFTYYTWVGDGLFVIALAIILFFVKQRVLAWKLCISFLFSGLIAQILKSLFHAPRPKTFFAESFYHHFIEGVTHGGNASFPSGHSATAFAAAAILSFNCSKKSTCIIAFWMAALVGYSRMYLGQHFLEDVLAGIITGISSAIFIEYIFKLYLTRVRAAKAPSTVPYEQPAVIRL